MNENGLASKATSFANSVGSKTKNAETFLKSDSTLAHVSFFALLIVVFYILMKVISKIVIYIYTRTNSGYIIKDLKPANILRTISQDPQDPNSVLIKRSVNRTDGIEFSYSCWIYVNSVSLGKSLFKPIFVKANKEDYINKNCNLQQTPNMTNTCEIFSEQNGCNVETAKGVNYCSYTKAEGGGKCGKSQYFSNICNTELAKEIPNGNLTGINYPDNGPGLYLFTKSKSANTYELSLLIVMNTVNNYSNSKNIFEYVVVNNISTQKWLNIITRVIGKNLDIYVNGNIVKRHVLKNVPQQNYGSLFVNGNGGFDGSVSGLKYYNKALTIMQITNIMKKGPNMNIDKSTLVTPPYLGRDWYFDNNDL